MIGGKKYPNVHLPSGLLTLKHEQWLQLMRSTWTHLIVIVIEQTSRYCLHQHMSKGVDADCYSHTLISHMPGPSVVTTPHPCNLNHSVCSSKIYNIYPAKVPKITLRILTLADYILMSRKGAHKLMEISKDEQEAFQIWCYRRLTRTNRIEKLIN